MIFYLTNPLPLFPFPFINFSPIMFSITSQIWLICTSCSPFLSFRSFSSRNYSFKSLCFNNIFLITTKVRMIAIFPSEWLKPGRHLNGLITLLRIPLSIWNGLTGKLVFDSKNQIDKKLLSWAFILMTEAMIKDANPKALLLAV